MRRLIPIMLASMLIFSTGYVVEAQTPMYRVSQTSYLGQQVYDKFSLWEDSTQLRGANIWQRVVVPAVDGNEFLGANHVGPPYFQGDFERLSAMGANYVNISGPGLFSEKPPYELDEAVQENLDNLLAMIEAADMFAVISFRTGPGRSDFTFYSEDIEEWGDPALLNDQVWLEQEAQDAWVEMWRYTAQRYEENSIVVGYDLMVEPNSEEVWLDIYGEPEEFYPEYAGTLYDWNQLYPRISTAIREVDTQTPILIGAAGYSAIDWLPYLELTGDPRSVYTVHQYAPVQYTHQDYPPEVTYPGVLDIDWDGELEAFNKQTLDDILSILDEFQSTHDDVPVAVNEFGLARWQPGAAQFMDDQMGLFEEHGLNYAVWNFNSSWPPHQENDAFDFLHGPDPDNHTNIEDNTLAQVIQRYWSKNTVRPSDFRPTSYRSTTYNKTIQQLRSLDDVTHWFYYLDVNLEWETVERIAASSYDMVVIDFIPSEENNTDYPIAEIVETLQQAPHPKLVIAYIDIGQAESFRTYWQDDWRVGDPAWIVSEDPDGWVENYPVAYWYDEYQAIWLGEDGYLQAILETGFDGVYLDWVEAYSDENVIAMAEAEGLDPRQEMIWWVEDIARFTRDQQPNFIVIAQNAAELTEIEEYREVIVAIAQEQVWFDGAADDTPPGDCPLPRTENEVESAAYEASLSAECLQLYQDFPESTLHVSSESYLDYLIPAHEAGLIVFTVDYAVEEENIAEVYRRSRELGFIPFASNRALDQYIELVP